jgi:predicted protein tyrosine phosphatase
MKMLFLCHGNIDRSPSVEYIYANRPGLQVKSAGTGWFAIKPVHAGLLQWCDCIICMEDIHKQYIVENYAGIIAGKRIDVLDIPNEYQYMQPELVEIIKEKMETLLNEYQQNK